MAIEFSIASDIERLTRNLSDLQRRRLPRAINSTLNKVATTVRKESVKEISRASGLKAKDVRARVDLIRSNFTRLEAIVKASGKHSNIARFNARQTRRGVSAAPWRKRRVFPGAFLGNQGRTAFIRTGKGRLPVKSLAGPSIPREFARDTAKKVLLDVGARRFREILPRELRFVLSQKGGR